MKRLDFEIVAAAMLQSRPMFPNELDNLRTRQWRRDCESLALRFAEQSRKFDRQLFLTNCGVQQT